MDFWKDCEGQTVDGVFALGEFLGGSEQAGVFVTSTGLQTGQPAAIKLIPSKGRNVEAQLVMWQRVSKLSHPNLVQLQRWGTCELRGVPMMYVVTERADEVLAHVLLERPLDASEARQLIEPVAGALAHLHDRGYVHGRVKPSNLFAIGEVLKLSVDDVVPLLEAGSIRRDVTAYDPPEAASGPVTPAADAWALGWTIVETLTQQRPGRGSLPDRLPEPFEEIVRNALRPDPAQRWTMPQIAARIRGERVSTSSGLPEPVRRYAIPVVAGAVVLAGIWLWPRGRDEETPPPTSTPPAVEPSKPKSAPKAPAQKDRPSPMPSPSTPAASKEDSRAAQELAPPEPAVKEPAPRAVGAAMSSEVVRSVLPDVPARAQRTVRGSFAVSVRVDIDERGNVKDTRLESRGPSRYFADLAVDAAKQWKFTPGSDRQRVIQFAFTRSGPQVAAVR
jgi:TonB family protein